MKLPNQRPRNQAEALLALTLVPRLGIQRIRLLLQSADHPAEIFTFPRDRLRAIEGIGAELAGNILSFGDWERVNRIMEQGRRADAQLLTYADQGYPPLLREIYDPPLLLWVRGDLAALQRPGLAIVGTRRATRYGLDMAASFGGELAAKGLSIVSGLAFGVDAAAHRAAVDAGGISVGVLGCGIDLVYPEKHAGLAADMIAEGGAVITEFLPGTEPEPGNFPVRNRIVSGLTMGTLVVESGLKGGSMLTAQSALGQNREVFVVPHALSNSNGVGCNHLIKRAAGKLVQSVEDVMEELPQYLLQEIGDSGSADGEPQQQRRGRWREAELDEEGRAICELLEEQQLHIDDISQALDRPAYTLLPKLLELEMQECVRQRPGKKFELL